MTTQPIRLGDLLVRAGVITDLDLTRALNEQKRWGGRLGTTLVRMGVLTEDLLVKALSKQLNLPRANLEAISLPPPLLQRLDRNFCERHGLVPLAYDQSQGRLLVAVADPLNNSGPEELGRSLGLLIEIYLAAESEITKARNRIFALVPGQGAPGALGNASTPVAALNTAASTPPPVATPAITASAHPPSPAAAGVPVARPPPGPVPGTGEVKLQQLDDLARKQTRAIQAVIELLIEKGVVTREEYLGWLQSR